MYPINFKDFSFDLQKGLSMTLVLLQEETWSKLTLFILDSSISSKLFFLEVHKDHLLLIQ